MTASVPMQIGSLFSGDNERTLICGRMVFSADLPGGVRTSAEAESTPPQRRCWRLGSHRYPEPGDITGGPGRRLTRSMSTATGGRFPCQDAVTASFHADRLPVRLGCDPSTRSGLWLEIDPPQHGFPGHRPVASRLVVIRPSGSGDCSMPEPTTSGVGTARRCL